MGRIRSIKKIFRRKKKSNVDYLLALDIGTEFVKAVIFGVSAIKEKEKRGVIVGFGRQRQLFGNMHGGAVTDIQGVVLTCEQAINQASQMARAKPKRAIIGIAGEFVKGSTTNFIYQRSDSEKKIDLTEIKNIVQKIQWKALDKLRKRFAWETGKPEIEIKLINALITEVRIDGYKVTNPLGFQGKEVFLSMFNVYAPMIHLRAVETIASKLDLDLLSIAAEPYALARSVYSEYFNVDTGIEKTPANSAIFIDIGGGTTDVALVRYGGVESIKSLALAGRSFTKRLAKTLGLGWVEAEEVKLNHSYHQMSDNAGQKIKNILEKDTNVWLRGLELVLEEFNQKEFFPPLILLCGGGALLPDIRNVLIKNKKYLREKFPFSQLPRIDFIQPRHIANIIDKTDLLKGPENVVPMALANLALDISNEDKKSLSTTLRRVVRMIRR